MADIDHKALAETLVNACLKKGADAAEAYLETGRTLSLEVRNGDIETIQEAAGGGAGIRVLVKGKIGFASSNDLSEKALDQTVAQAVAYAGISTADPANAFPEDKGETDVRGLFDAGIAAVPMERKIELAKALEKLAMKDPRITRSDGAGYGESEGEVFLANSNGLAKSYKSSGCGLRVAVVAEKGEQRSSGGDSCERRFYADLKSPEEIAAKAARTAWEALDPKPVKTQRAAVIFDRDIAYAIFGGILSAVNGESVLQGRSFLGKSLGRSIGSELLTFVDDGTLEKGLASAPFDGEGVPTSRHVIIERGVLRCYLYNTIAARRAGTTSTGNASRESRGGGSPGGFAGLPGIGPHNLSMTPGDVTPEEIIKATPRGLLLKEVTGYGINPVNGNFSGGASGFWIENGAIAYPVQGLTIAGTADEILNGIDLVGRDIDRAGAEVGPTRALNAPTFRVKVLQIGGA